MRTRSRGIQSFAQTRLTRLTRHGLHLNEAETRSVFEVQLAMYRCVLIFPNWTLTAVTETNQGGCLGREGRIGQVKNGISGKLAAAHSVESAIEAVFAVHLHKVQVEKCRRRTWRSEREADVKLLAAVGADCSGLGMACSRVQGSSSLAADWKVLRS